MGCIQEAKEGGLISMCGRYRLSRRKQVIEEYFGTDSWDEDWNPRYNIAPTQPVPVIRQKSKEPYRIVTLMRWGLIPFWAKEPSVASGTINARSETASIKPAFAEPFKFRRCLIPADGFYEWKRSASLRQPFCFEVGQGELFAFAGLWDGWKDNNGNWIRSCSILTTTPNALTSAVHDRMPVILNSHDYDMWLDPGLNDVTVVSELVRPYDAQLMRSYPVSSRINSVANDDVECSVPVTIHQRQSDLFGLRGVNE